MSLSGSVAVNEKLACSLIHKVEGEMVEVIVGRDCVVVGGGVVPAPIVKLPDQEPYDTEVIPF